MYRRVVGSDVRSRILQLRSGAISPTTFAILMLALPIRMLKVRMLRVHVSVYGSFGSRTGLLERAGQCASKAGLWLEFGVFRGESINFLASRFDEHFYGFDSFEGLPKSWGIEHPEGAFSLGGALPDVLPNVTLVRGWFDRTLPAFLREHPGEQVSFLHVDSDLYESARIVLEGLSDRIHPGTIIVFDEFCGASPNDEARAFREYLRSSHSKFEYLGSALEAGGSVAVRVTA
jgi:hypothetical protein